VRKLSVLRNGQQRSEVGVEEKRNIESMDRIKNNTKSTRENEHLSPRDSASIAPISQGRV